MCSVRIVEVHINTELCTKMPLWRIPFGRKTKDVLNFMPKVRNFSWILSKCGFTQHVITKAPNSKFHANSSSGSSTDKLGQTDKHFKATGTFFRL
jgi:hypothetical protein